MLSTISSLFSKFPKHSSQVMASASCNAKKATASWPDDSHNLLDQELRLDGVAEDVIYLIFSELTKSSGADVVALAQASKTLRQSGLPFVYQNLVLRKGTSKSRCQRAFESILEEFRKEKECQLARHVRCITVKDKIPANDLLLILNKISECGVLRKIRQAWSTNPLIAIH